MFERLKLNFCTRILGKKGEFMLISVQQKDDGDFLCAALLSKENAVLTEAFTQVMNTHKDIREYVLERAENYLKRFEIESKNFAEKILAK